MAKKKSSLAKLVETKPVPETIDKKTISHSQYTVYHNCPHQWYLRYPGNIKPFTSTMNTVFGTAMHETLQEYLRVMYTESGTAADKMNLEIYLHDRMFDNYELELIKNNGEHFSNLDEMREFFDDGVQIIRFLKKKRKIFFSIKGVELLGIEIHIMQPTEGNPNVYFEGYIDMTIYDLDLDKVIIYDFKTSKKGWKDQYEKKDETKIDQILWYKRYFSRQYEFPEEKIDVNFMILKRKIWEEAEWPQPRISNFKPINGVMKMKKAIYNMDKFVEECFTPEGEYNLEREFLKTPSEKSCKFCPFNNDETLCNKKNL